MRIFFKAIGVLLLLTFIVLSVQTFEAASLLHELRFFIGKPHIFIMLVIMYGFAFILRAYAWRLYLGNRITVREGLYGLLYSLLVNHISPVKAGDAVRVAVVTKKERISFAEAAQSVVVLRVLDFVVLGSFGTVGLFLMFGKFALNAAFIVSAVIMAAAGLLLLNRIAPKFLKAQISQLRAAVWGWRGIFILLLTAGSWVLEAFVVFGVARTIPFLQALWVNSVTIAGQVFQFTPGGVGTYETVMTFALKALGMSTAKAYECALLSHGFKFLFSYAAGAIVLLVYPIQLTSFLRQKRKGETFGWKK